MEELTIEKLEALPPHTLFARGTTTDDDDGVNMTGSGKRLRWVAVRGFVADWAIYTHWDTHSEEWIRRRGDKVGMTYNIMKLVPCTPEVLKRYRY